MTNREVADGATAGSPVTLKVSDMFTLMPYENSLVVLKHERAAAQGGPGARPTATTTTTSTWPGYGGYSYYTTCMLDTNFGGQITYNDLHPAAYDSAKSYVVSLKLPDGRQVDFGNASKYYKVSTVNYLAAGSCNFNNGGVSLWPLNQIVNDTQYYVRDAVIDYVSAQTAPIAPAIEGRLAFITDADGPVIKVTVPKQKPYNHHKQKTLAFGATDTPAGVASISAKLDGKAVKNGQRIDFLTLKLGSHTLTVTAMDKAGNKSVKSATFTVKATTTSLIKSVRELYDQGEIASPAARNRLLTWLYAARTFEKAGMSRLAVLNLASFSVTVALETPGRVTRSASRILIDDSIYVMAKIRNVKL